jgi:transposase
VMGDGRKYEYVIALRAVETVDFMTAHWARLPYEFLDHVSRRIVNDRDTFVALLDELDGESKIALEATYGWEWLADLLEDHGYELRLAHPLKTKAIASARVKTAAVDARTLAHLLRADLLPEAYVAPRGLRDSAICCGGGWH